MGVMLFLTKAVRAVNDNCAPIIYNQVGLINFFMLGFAISMFSVVCALALAYIHPEKKQDAQ